MVDLIRTLFHPLFVHGFGPLRAIAKEWNECASKDLLQTSTRTEHRTDEMAE